MRQHIAPDRGHVRAGMFCLPVLFCLPVCLPACLPACVRVFRYVHSCLYELLLDDAFEKGPAISQVHDKNPCCFGLAHVLQRCEVGMPAYGCHQLDFRDHL